MSIEYSPECNYVEEYDPEVGWEIEGIEYTPPTVSYEWITDLFHTLNAAQVDRIPKKTHAYVAREEKLSLGRKIQKQVDESGNRLDNVSALYMLSKLRLRNTPENLQMVHKAIRELQLEELRMTEHEFGRIQINRKLMRAIEDYIRSKSIFNLSPEWALKLARMKFTRYDIIVSMKCIDEFTR